MSPQAAHLHGDDVHTPRTICVLLGAGALLNVIVAFTCTLIEFNRLPEGALDLPTGDDRAAWKRFAPRGTSGWINGYTYSERGFGFDRKSIPGPGATSLCAPPDRVLLIRSGWPLRCFRAGWYLPADDTRRVPYPPWSSGVDVHYAVLPIRPITGPFMLNALAYAVTIFLAVRTHRSVQSAWRAARGRCQHCGYILHMQDRCSECGRKDGGRATQAGPDCRGTG